MKQPQVRNISEKLLSDNWYILKKYTYEIQRHDGSWQQQSREVYDRGDGAVILLYNKVKNSIILIRQFRMPMYVAGYQQLLVEAAAGLLEGASPEARIIAEAEEETGYQINNIEKVFEAFMSPGSVTEKLHFYIAEYSDKDRHSEGGGLADEGEDIEVMEWSFPDAFNAIKSGDIVDGKTIMLIQHLAISGILNINP
ncbi:MAG: NUDIX domain-containing protein [Providencia rustigianii]|uniref:NUDIX domain-containing protein n=1 Tax=Providencia rustigianii TaxID=158850 RepID=UPI000D86EC1B|nr:NUDIX domain-containing protein [Providencia rustigianii]SPY79129.1 GDP-mannose pyrophosphatase nudK [Providencia rustigianii]